MRIIKFRGKRVGNGEWTTGTPFITDEGTYMIPCVSFDFKRMGNVQFEGPMIIPETIGQFTGLTDKNVKEIFEGDIVKKMGIVYTIAWNNLHAMWGLFTKDGQSNEEIVCDTTDEKGNICKFWQDSSLSVIGNIHDNKDLLK